MCLQQVCPPSLSSCHLLQEVSTVWTRELVWTRRVNTWHDTEQDLRRGWGVLNNPWPQVLEMSLTLGCHKDITRRPTPSPSYEGSVWMRERSKSVSCTLVIVNAVGGDSNALSSMSTNNGCFYIGRSPKHSACPETQNPLNTWKMLLQKSVASLCSCRSQISACLWFMELHLPFLLETSTS